MASEIRRRLLRYGWQFPAALLLTKAAAAACVDPDELSDSVRGMRESLDYTDDSKKANEACSGCSFFKPAKPGDRCGHCEVLTGTVDAKGHCDSWTKRS